MKIRRLLVSLCVYSVGVLLAVELAARTNYHLRHRRLPFFLPASQFAYRYYPALQPAVQDQASPSFRLLVLGASTLHPEFGDVVPLLQSALESARGAPVRVDNLSVPGHGALDSYYKYWYLRRQSFNLVIVYHGLNELRANNVPDELWKDDYSHYWWYDEVNFYFTHERLAQLGWLAPFYLKSVLVKLDQNILHRHRYVPDTVPSPEWLPYGASVKTARPFRRDLERIVRLAEAKREPLLLMTLAYALPAGYTKDRLRQGRLGYVPSPKASPLELWGTPEHILKGLRVHNAIIAEVAAAHHVLFVDQAALMGGDPQWFIDLCHLSPAGAERFVANIMAELQRQGVDRWPAGGQAKPLSPKTTASWPRRMRSLRRRFFRSVAFPIVGPHR